MSELIYAEVDENNIVTRMLVLPEEQRGRGERYLTEDMNFTGQWFRTETDGTYRKQPATLGSEFRAEVEGYPDGLFISPQPFPSYVLNDTFDWVPPVPKPSEEPAEGKVWIWAEEAQEWIEIILPDGIEE